MASAYTCAYQPWILHTSSSPDSKHVLAYTLDARADQSDGSLTMDPYHGQPRVPAPRLSENSQRTQASYPTLRHAQAPENHGLRQYPLHHEQQHHQLHQGMAANAPVLLQGHSARTQDVRVQCEAPDCQALLQVPALGFMCLA